MFLPEGQCNAKQQLTIPSGEDLRVVRAEILEFYKSELSQAKSSKQQRALANALLNDARATPNDLRSKYALLELAQLQAISAGDVDLTIQIADEIAAAFAISEVLSRANAIQSIRREKIRLEKEECKGLAATVMELIDPLVDEEQVDLAFELTGYATELAKKSRDFPLFRTTKNYRDDIAILRTDYATHCDALPELRAANSKQAYTAAGIFRCYVLNDWPAGLELLTHSDDQKLRQLAIDTLVKNPEGSEAMRVADQWWDRLGTLKGRKRRVLAAFCSELYKQSIPSIGDDVRDQAQNRITEAKQINTLALGDPVKQTDKWKSRAAKETKNGSNRLPASQKLATLRGRDYSLLKSKYNKFEDAFDVSF